jgi:hypothetical protein
MPYFDRLGGKQALGGDDYLMLSLSKGMPCSLRTWNVGTFTLQNGTKSSRQEMQAFHAWRGNYEELRLPLIGAKFSI